MTWRRGGVRTAECSLVYVVMSVFKHDSFDDITFAVVSLGHRYKYRFALCYGTVVLSVLSVTLVYCGQTVGWIKKKLGMEVGLGLSHLVLDPSPFPQFSAHVHYGQTARL